MILFSKYFLISFYIFDTSILVEIMFICMATSSQLFCKWTFEDTRGANKVPNGYYQKAEHQLDELTSLVNQFTMMQST